MKHTLPGVFLILIFFLLPGCIPTKTMRVLSSPERFMAISKYKFLKVHLKNGDLYILDEWTIDSDVKKIFGTGTFYNSSRTRISAIAKPLNTQADSTYEICHDEIALLETNYLQNNRINMAAITLVGVPLALMNIYCIIDPKACFGSCPTFYTRQEGEWRLAAEGFSSSILPVFEKDDTDMLYRAQNEGGTLTLKLTNEALETHVIRYADLYCFPANPGQRVFSTQDGEFWRVQKLQTPAVCRAEEGDCTNLVKAVDLAERYSSAHENNLVNKEELIFSFENEAQKNRGLVVSSRQTLLTTWLFYQGLAYAGNYAGYFSAAIESGNQLVKNRVQKVWDKLGGIEVYMQKNSGGWEKLETIHEMGPIATDLHLIRLPADVPANATFKLKMTQGLWRIDYLALGELLNQEPAVAIQPKVVFHNDSVNNKALDMLNDSASSLITFPGDVYFLQYTLPENRDYEFFLHSRGYYLEWMRDEWLMEQNLRKAKFMLTFPGLYMRMAAKEFKKSEANMEQQFWGSRYVLYE